VDPVPDPLLLRKSGSAGNRIRNLRICSQELWPLDHRGGPDLPLPYENTKYIFSYATDVLQRFQSKTLRSILNAPWYISIHRIHEDLQMNTVLSEIKRGRTKYFRKLENHTNAMAVNVLKNSETTHRLKMYTVLTLADRPEWNPNTRIKMLPKGTKKLVWVTPLGITHSRVSTNWTYTLTTLPWRRNRLFLGRKLLLTKGRTKMKFVWPVKTVSTKSTFRVLCFYCAYCCFRYVRSRI
jgi:hypothetical protein